MTHRQETPEKATSGPQGVEQAADGALDAGTHERAADAHTEPPAVRQLLVHPAVWPHLEAWLAGRGIELARQQFSDDDLPTYVMGLAEPSS